MESYKDLDVFKLSHELTLQIYRVTETFPQKEQFGLISQMRRAAYSIPMNIAEGSHRLSKAEYRHFVGIAKGSTGEIKYQLLLATDLGYLKKEIYERLIKEYERVSQMLTKLAKALEK